MPLVNKLYIEQPYFRPGSWQAYLVAVVVVGIAAGLRMMLALWGSGGPLLTLYPAVLAVIFLAGSAAGILAIFLSVLAGWLFILPGANISEPGYRLFLFTLVGLTIVTIVGVMRSITANTRRLNEILQKSAAKFRGLLESAPDAMVIADAQGVIELVNVRTEELFGYARHEMLGKPVGMLISELGAVPNSPVDAASELVGIRKNGLQFPIEISQSPLSTESGARVLRAIRDITERKEIEAKLAAASRAKSDFLASMSHELRTPLNAVVGFAELLRMKGQDKLTKTQDEYVSYILEGGNYLRDLVNRLLDLAGIEAGRLDLSVERLSARSMVEQAYRLMLPVAQKAGVTLEYKAPQDEIELWADEMRLRQALFNFLSNAIKYNQTSGTVLLRAASLENGFVRFIVTDTGIGIPKDRHENVFEPFQRLGAEQTAVEGAGIGLALSRRLIEAMGGTVGFTSEVGRGSDFWLDLPMDRPTAL